MPTSAIRRSLLVAAAAAPLLAIGRSALAAGQPLNHVDQGKGRPEIVFVHGFSCSLDDWSRQLDGLSGKHRCVAVDLPGHGKSPKSAQATIAAMGAAVAETIRALDLRRAVLVGHSMGCRVISDAWTRAPERVAGLIYIDGSLIQGDSSEVVNRNEARLAKEGPDAVFDALYKDFFVESSPQAVKDAVYAHRPHIDRDFHSRLFLDMVRYDTTISQSVLQTVKVPALVIQSTALDNNFKRVPIAEGVETPWMQAVRKRVDRARIATVPGVGHFTMMEAPKRTNELIERFVDRIRA